MRLHDNLLDIGTAATEMQATTRAMEGFLVRQSRLWQSMGTRHDAMTALCQRCLDIAGLDDIGTMERLREEVLADHARLAAAVLTT